MINKDDLNEIYKENLTENIINCISKTKKIPIDQAMDIFFRSRLAKEIQDGKYGIENLSYQYLTEDLIENEPELFQK